MSFMTERRDDLGLLILRVGVSLGMLSHGYPKFLALISGNPIKFADPIGIGMTASLALAVFSEFICSILLIVGYKTRLASIPLAITMFVAAFVIHAQDPFGRKEKAILYLLTYIVIFLLGAGRLSLDTMFGKKK
jgi:putative oxidoreductase